jgi:hypothetical protein
MGDLSALHIHALRTITTETSVTMRFRIIKEAVGDFEGTPGSCSKRAAGDLRKALKAILALPDVQDNHKTAVAQLVKRIYKIDPRRTTKQEFPASTATTATTAAPVINGLIQRTPECARILDDFNRRVKL